MQQSLIDDDKGAVAAWCNGMRNARRDDENLSLLDADDVASDIEVHLPLQNQQGLGKIVCLVRIRAIVRFPQNGGSMPGFGTSSKR